MKPRWAQHLRSLPSWGPVGTMQGACGRAGDRAVVGVGGSCRGHRGKAQRTGRPEEVEAPTEERDAAGGCLRVGCRVLRRCMWGAWFRGGCEQHWKPEEAAGKCRQADGLKVCEEVGQAGLRYQRAGAELPLLPRFLARRAVWTVAPLA